MSAPLFVRQIREEIAKQFTTGEDGIRAVWQATFGGIPMPSPMKGGKPRTGDKWIVISCPRMQPQDDKVNQTSQHTYAVAVTVYQYVGSGATDLIDLQESLMEFLLDKVALFDAACIANPRLFDGGNIDSMNQGAVTVGEVQGFTVSDQQALELYPAQIELSITITTSKGVA